MFGILQDSPEYELRKRTPFKPSTTTLSEIRASIPKHLYEKSTSKGLLYFARDVFSMVIVFKLGTLIEPLLLRAEASGVNPTTVRILKWVLWGLYMQTQGIVFAGWWCLAHEAGHGTLSPHSYVNNTLGFILHTFLLIPYYAWRSTHHAHHKASNSVERDENFVPQTRSDLNLPPESKARTVDYHEILEEAPIFTLMQMLVMQAMGMQLYLTKNVMGSPSYPPGTNHFSPSSPLFKPQERNGIIASNISLAMMSSILWAFAKNVGMANFIRLYFVPYILANHWIVMLTYIQHSDPTVPHYRNKQWTFLRGALATVDRPLLGWVGRFFLHNISHDHVAHHINSSIPFYNQPEVTKHIKMVLKEDYNYDSTNTFRALYRTFTQCCFIEDDGDIVFYKNRDGKAARVLAEGALEDPTKTA